MPVYLPYRELLPVAQTFYRIRNAISQPKAMSQNALPNKPAMSATSHRRFGSHWEASTVMNEAVILKLWIARQAAL